MSCLRAEGLSFAFTDAAPVFTSVTLHLSPGFTGLVGENGAGKSTFLRILAGELAATDGRVVVEPAGASIAFCRQSIDEPGGDVEALAAAWAGARLEWLGTPARHVARMVEELDLDPVQVERWASLSPGERRRWQLAAALARDPDVLLLDEPTNHVDAVTRDALLRMLRAYRGVGLVVSHDRALLEALTTSTVRFHRGEARLYPAAYDAARRLWAADTAASWERRATAQDRARAAARRLDEARRDQAAADARRATSRRAKGPKDHDARTLAARTRVAWAEARLGRNVEVVRREAERAASAVPDAAPEKDLGRSLFVGCERAPRPTLLSLQRAAIAAATGAEPLLRDVSLMLGRDDRVRLAGPNGAGKTTLLSALLDGATLPRERILHLPQELPADAGGELLAELRGLAPGERGRVLALVAALGVDPERLLASRAPSPGEARKLLLALGLGRHAWIAVLDEPTNHLDLPSVERIEAALASYPGAVLLVSHDDAFARRCTTTTWRIEGGRVHIE